MLPRNFTRNGRFPWELWAITTRLQSSLNESVNFTESLTLTTSASVQRTLWPVEIRWTLNASPPLISTGKKQKLLPRREVACEIEAIHSDRAIFSCRVCICAKRGACRSLYAFAGYRQHYREKTRPTRILWCQLCLWSGWSAGSFHQSFDRHQTKGTQSSKGRLNGNRCQSRRDNEKQRRVCCHYYGDRRQSPFYESRR